MGIAPYRARIKGGRRGRAARNARSCLTLLVCIFIATPCSVPGQGVAAAKDAAGLTLVSLGPAITEKLYLLGVEDRLIGVTTYCTRPQAACTKEKVGSVTQVSIEKIVDLRPDLVLVTSLTDTRAVRNVGRAGLSGVVFDEPASFAEMNNQFIELGRMVGKEDLARRIVRAAEQKVNRIREKVRTLGKPNVFIQIGSKPLFTATRHSFVSDMVELAGATNIAADAKAGLYSREEVLLRDPDVILIVGMGVVPAAEKKAWQRFPTMKAVRNDRIFVLDPYTTCSPTPETFVDALLAIAAAVHPDLEVNK